jgi:hypothetical protein
MHDGIVHDTNQTHANCGQRLEMRFVKLPIQVTFCHGGKIGLRSLQYGPVVVQEHLNIR